MKRSKMLLVALLALALSLFTACTTVVPHEHAHSDWETIVAPTETENGLARRSCECGDVQNVYLPALVDEFWTVTENASTHLVHGSLVYSSEYVDIVFELPLLEEHVFGDWSITAEPTIDAEGSAEKVCPCGEVETVTVPALSNTDVWTISSVTAPTHFKVGADVYTSVYGEVSVEIAIIPHAYGDWTITVEPTADAEGVAVRTCVCEYEDVVAVPALTDETVWNVTAEVPSTHFEHGSKTYSSVYGDVTARLALDPTHVYGDWTLTVDPTLTTVGSAVKVCACGDEFVEEVPVLANADVWTVTAETPSTHFENGARSYASVYGEVTIVLVLNPDHVYGEWTLTEDPTVDGEGLAVRYCQCGDAEEGVVPALSDDTVWTVIAETPADYNNGGDKTYASVYGEVVAATAKLVAPYDNKTYSNVYYSAEKDDYYYKHGVVNADTTWSTASATIGADGTGEGDGYPYRGSVSMVMVNAATGEMTMTVSSTSGSTGEVSRNVYNAYVDMATGLIVIPRRAGDPLNDILVLTPFTVGLENTVTVASSWTNSIAIDYVVDGACNVSIFVHKEVVYFGVSFVDANGNAIAANECYNAPYVYVYDKDGNLIEGFAFNGEDTVITDKHEGTYTGALGEVVLSGYGTLTIGGVLPGTYVVDGDVVGVYANGEYYEAVISGNTYTATKPMVTITFEEGAYANIEDVTVNKNIAIVLPTMTSDRYTFKGWYLDANFANAVASEFVPTEDVTLYALWAEKVVITLVGVVDGDADVLYLGEGDVIGEYLPVYGIEGTKRFIGWFLDENGEESLPEDAEVSAEDTGITIYAIWVDLPAYYGTFKGSNLYGASNGGSVNINIAIDENGNITGKVTGTVVSYDPATQIIVYESSNSTYRLFYDQESGILAGGWNKGTSLGSDYIVYSRAYNGESSAKISHGAVQVAKTEGDSSIGYYARLALIATDNGDELVFIYRDHIYSNITVSDALGNEVTVDNYKSAKTLIVKKDGVIIFAVASKGDNFGANANTIELDEYFGTYVNGDDVLVLDGAGAVSYNGVEGTYAVSVVGSAYGFDVYLANNTEYYEVTLNGNSFTAVKPMVTITFEEGAYATIEDVTVNKNIVYTLPVLTHESNVFNGWYYDAEFTSPVGTAFAPIQDVTVYAWWKVKKVFTAVYNNGAEDLVVEYSEGDLVEIDMPVYAKHEFKGWYTTPDFVEGTEWTSGVVIEEDITIYAKWIEAEPYYNTYMPTRIEMNNYLQGTSYIFSYNSVVSFNPDGSGTSNGNPIGNGNFVMNEYVKETGYIKITRGTSTYYGYVDAATGIMILNYTTTAGVGLKKVALYTPFESGLDIKSRISSSYWAEGLYRTIQYTYDGTVYSVFVCGESVYFGATFEDGNGNAVLGVNCYTAETLIVKDKDGNLIKKFAHDGSMLQPMDGYEGSYTGEHTVTVNGVSKITIDGVEGSYALADSDDYTIDAYVDGAYYQVTLNKADYTAVVVMPMVNVAFETAGLADVATISTNMNIACELPVPTCDTHVFRGWYFDAEFTSAVPAEFVPTADVTVYAKWAAKVVLTIVYGDGAESITQDYASDDVVAPAVISELNGLFFQGWYLDAECTVPFTATSIGENTTIYAKWSSAAPFTVGSYGSYAMAYDATTGTWKNTNQGKGSSTSGITITATVVDLVVTFDWKVSSEGNWDFMRVYLNGTIAFGSSKSEGSGEKSGSLTFTVPAGASIQIFFEKDSGGNKGDDTLTLSNLTVNGVPVTAMN